MSQSIQFQNHPFRFLLYLEWVLLAIALITEFLPHPVPRYPLLTIASLIAFGLMGLKIPTGKLTTKIIYTACEILLILLTASAGGRAIRLFAFLYLILVTRSCLIFKLPGRLAITGLSFALFFNTLMRRFEHVATTPTIEEKLRFFVLGYPFFFGLSLVFVLLLMNAVLAERQIRDKLEHANQQLRQYALLIEDQATLQERNRIARDIHDSLGHSLTALNLQLETGLKLWQSNPTKAMSFLVMAKELGSKALQDVRQSVSTMRANPLQGKSLEKAITLLIDDFCRVTGISPTCEIDISTTIPLEVSTAIYRLTQESFTNISKYAYATKVIFQLTMTHKGLMLMIQDNGQGFNLEQNTTGFGLQSMRDRTLAIQGQFKIESTPGSGCKITAFFPILTIHK